MEVMGRSFQTQKYGLHFPSQGKSARERKFLRNGIALPNSVEAGHQDAAVAQINPAGIVPELVPVVG
jgi:hypothetical protein